MTPPTASRRQLVVRGTPVYVRDVASVRDGYAPQTNIVHVEGNAHLHRTVQKIKALGKRAGVVFNPATPVGAIEEILQDVELVLVMTVNPGFGGQQFIQSTLHKIRKVRELIYRVRPGCDLEVDGGIEPHTIGAAGCRQTRA